MPAPAMEAGAPALGLHTSPIMVSALRMYEAIGFVRDGDMSPIRGVPYGRYILAAKVIDTAVDRILAEALQMLSEAMAPGPKDIGYTRRSTVE